VVIIGLLYYTNLYTEGFTRSTVRQGSGCAPDEARQKSFSTFPDEEAALVNNCMCQDTAKSNRNHTDD
jgi:hypothetical protein